MAKRKTSEGFVTVPVREFERLVRAAHAKPRRAQRRKRDDLEELIDVAVKVMTIVGPFL